MPHFRRNQRPFVSGFTLIELLVVISIIALLISILLPALSSARESGQSVACLSNIRQMLIASHAYATDSKDFLPSAIAPSAGDSYHNANAFWFRALTTKGSYIDSGALACPTDINPNDWASGIGKTTGERISYGYSGVLGNDYLIRTSSDPNRDRLFAQRRIGDFQGGSGPKSDPAGAFMFFDYVNTDSANLPGTLNNKIDVGNGYSTDHLSVRHFNGFDQLSSSNTNFPAMAGGSGGRGNFGFVGGHAQNISAPYASSRWSMDPVFATDYAHAGFFTP